MVNTPACVLQALDIEARYEISFWDALIFLVAESSGVAILYSEDLQVSKATVSFVLLTRLYSMVEQE